MKPLFSQAGAVPRRFRCFGIGTGRTGTKSLAQILSAHFRVAHEPESEQLIEVYLRQLDGRAAKEEMATFVREHDLRLNLEFEADGTLACCLPHLVSEFADARFILTVRDCYTWVASVIAHNAFHKPSGFWKAFDDAKYRHWSSGFGAPEAVLQRRGLRPLRNYFSHWADHYNSAVATVPEDRLLVLRTDRIALAGPELAAFLDIDESTLNMSAAHANRAFGDTRLLRAIDATYVEQVARECCGPIMDRIFPEIDSINAAFRAAAKDPSR